jgi:hypothetical protein
MLSVKFIAMNVYIKNTERSQINDLMLHIKHPEKQDKLNPKPAQGQRDNKNKGAINEIEVKKNTINKKS